MDNLGVVYFTASTDDVETNTRFAESMEADYPILSDPEGTAATAYGVYDADRNFAGRVTFIIGKGGEILHIETSVQVRSHGNDVIEKVKELVRSP